MTDNIFTKEGIEEIIKYMDYVPGDHDAKLNVLKAMANSLLM